MPAPPPAAPLHASELGRLASRERLPGHAARLVAMTSQLRAEGRDAVEIGAEVARAGDALVRAVLGWAEAEAGRAPAPYAWLALGSEGRREQVLPTDQDSALVHGGGDAEQPWFARLAARAGADLAAAGLPPCPGGFMASRWHGSLERWEERARGWLARPTPQALLEAAIFSDRRMVQGALDLAPLRAVFQSARGEPAFIAGLIRAALAFRPPSALALHRRGRFDPKLEGTAPVVLLARALALAVGSGACGTLERLDALAEAGALAPDARDGLREAYRFLLGLRLSAGLGEGGAEERGVALDALAPEDRAHLRDALRSVRRWQRASASQLAGGA